LDKFSRFGLGPAVDRDPPTSASHVAWIIDMSYHTSLID
jgi:hypothetical protein